jgi:hypothetical protein
MPAAESGSDVLVADSSGETSASETLSRSGRSVEIGLSAFGCSNVANFIEQALDALDLGDVEGARTALLTAAATVALRTIGSPDHQSGEPSADSSPGSP